MSLLGDSHPVVIRNLSIVSDGAFTTIVELSSSNKPVVLEHVSVTDRAGRSNGVVISTDARVFLKDVNVTGVNDGIAIPNIFKLRSATLDNVTVSAAHTGLLSFDVNTAVINSVFGASTSGIASVITG